MLFRSQRIWPTPKGAPSRWMMNHQGSHAKQTGLCPAPALCIISCTNTLLCHRSRGDQCWRQPARRTGYCRTVRHIPCHGPQSSSITRRGRHCCPKARVRQQCCQNGRKGGSITFTPDVIFRGYEATRQDRPVDVDRERHFCRIPGRNDGFGFASRCSSRPVDPPAYCR